MPLTYQAGEGLSAPLVNAMPNVCLNSKNSGFLFQARSECMHPSVFLGEQALFALSSQHVAKPTVVAKPCKTPLAESTPSTQQALIDILKDRTIRIYGTNNSWGSYLYVHFKNGNIRELWVGNQCRSPYIEISREEYNDIALIKWQQGTRFSYDYPKPYAPPQDPSTIFALFVNDHSLQALRGGSPDELRESIVQYGETVLPGHSSALTPATWHHGADAVISQLEGLANNPELKRIAPEAESEARHWHREGQYVKRLYS